MFPLMSGDDLARRLRELAKMVENGDTLEAHLEIVSKGEDDNGNPEYEVLGRFPRQIK